jgi:hypothetical protein
VSAVDSTPQSRFKTFDQRRDALRHVKQAACHFARATGTQSITSGVDRFDDPTTIAQNGY